MSATGPTIPLDLIAVLVIIVLAPIIGCPGKGTGESDEDECKSDYEENLCHSADIAQILTTQFEIQSEIVCNYSYRCTDDYEVGSDMENAIDQCVKNAVAHKKELLASGYCTYDEEQGCQIQQCTMDLDCDIMEDLVYLLSVAQPLTEWCESAVHNPSSCLESDATVFCEYPSDRKSMSNGAKL